jgi:uncharacterized protein (DUF58 family)
VIRPTGRGWAAAVLVVLALGLAATWRYPGLAAAGLALAVLFAASIGSLLRPGHLAAHRTVDLLYVPRLEPCTATLTVSHTGRWRPVLVDGVEPVGAWSVAVPAAWLRPGSRLERVYPVPTGRRGRLQVGPVRLRRYGLAGLAARTGPTGDAVTVRVLPRMLPVRAVPPGTRRGHVSGDERVAHGGTDLVGLREYLPGDDLRRLHWATSARTGTLMVREDADPSQAHLAVVLDDRMESYRLPGADPEALFEEAVDAAASLAGAASAAGHPVSLRSVTRRIDLEVPGGNGGQATGRPAPELLAALADVALQDSPTDAAGAAGPGADVLALVTGSGADLNALVVEASRAVVGVVLAVDPEPVAPVRAGDPVMVLAGARADLLVRRWDETVAGAAG